jgi:hypothetical protein
MSSLSFDSEASDQSGSPNVSTSSGSMKMNQHNDEPTKARRIRRILWLLTSTFSVVGMIGIFGMGYCNHELRFAPHNQDLKTGALTVREYKGDRRFITRADDLTCSVSIKMNFLGIGAACLCSFAYFFLAGGRKDV